MALSTAQVNFVARFMGVVPRATQDAIQTLSGAYPGVAISASKADPTLLRIGGTPHQEDQAGSRQGGIDLHPGTVAALKGKPAMVTGIVPVLADRQAELMWAMENPTTRDGKKIIASFQKTDNERWRFDDTYQDTVTKLQAVPGNLDALQDILDTATPGGKNRLAQIQISHNLPEEAAINTRGVELALQSGATDCYEVVAYVEFFYKIVADMRSTIDLEVENDERPKNTPKKRKKEIKVERLQAYMGQDTLLDTVKRDAQAKISLYVSAMAPYVGPAYTDGALDTADTDAIAGTLASHTAQVLFSGATGAGYHLLKHFEELYHRPPDESDLDTDATRYVTDAHDCVADRSFDVSMGQTGSFSFAFKKAGHSAFVPVKGDAALLASYF